MRGMKKRTLAAILWFYTGWYAGATIAVLGPTVVVRDGVPVEPALWSTLQASGTSRGLTQKSAPVCTARRALAATRPGSQRPVSGSALSSET